MVDHLVSTRYVPSICVYVCVTDVSGTPGSQANSFYRHNSVCNFEMCSTISILVLDRIARQLLLVQGPAHHRHRAGRWLHHRRYDLALALGLSLSHTHTHTHTVSLSRTHTRTISLPGGGSSIGGVSSPLGFRVQRLMIEMTLFRVFKFRFLDKGWSSLQKSDW